VYFCIKMSKFIHFFLCGLWCVWLCVFSSKHFKDFVCLQFLVFLSFT
jgi:hypothetical protein